MSSTEVIWKGAEDLRDRLVPVDSVRPHPLNPRRGEVAAIAEAIDRVGQRKPIVVRQGEILAGNHVYRAVAEALGWSHIAVVRADDLDDEDAMAYLIADNRTSDLGTYDEQALAEIVLDLEHGRGLVGTGYDEEAVRELSARVAEAEAAAGEPTEEPERGGVRVEYACPKCGHTWVS